MAQGKVKWFDSGKGYGYITPYDGTQDVFFHVSAIAGESKTLETDTSVEYEVLSGPRGLQAENVRALPPS